MERSRGRLWAQVSRGANEDSLNSIKCPMYGIEEHVRVSLEMAWISGNRKTLLDEANDCEEQQKAQIILKEEARQLLSKLGSCTVFSLIKHHNHNMWSV